MYIGPLGKGSFRIKSMECLIGSVEAPLYMK